MDPLVLQLIQPPGIPINLEIADVSVKSTSSWKIAVSWEAPVSGGNGLIYHVYRSTDNITFTKQSEVSGIAHIDTGLSQQTYYYKIKACDSTNNCGAFSSIVSLYPDGRFVTPAELISGPEVTGVTTKYATINWVTSRVSDSKIAYGVEPGIYFENEPSNSDQKTSHSIKLVNLSPNTRYYYVTKWTDEDGNTGQSPEGTFLTEPAPTITDPKIVSFNLSTATVKFTSKGASKVRIYYGESASFGFVEEVPTVTEESTYTVILDNLKDGTKYFYKINTFDADNAEYEGNSLTFTTLPRPKISNVRVQQVLGTAQPTALITWETNTETNSIVTYTIRGGSSRDEVNVAFTKTHRIIVRSLTPDTDYNFVARGRDRNGNEASSTPQLITTATDTRAPAVSNLQIESTDIPSSAGGTEGSTSQLIITWDTDEASTSQVEYDAGTGPSYSQRIQEDKTMTFNHSVVISGLKPSSVYHLRVISSDKAGNKGVSADTVTITPKGSDNALDLVINNLSQIFSFIRR
jgi:phosphodiesterase/alkaline phosphatase D-like protein